MGFTVEEIIKMSAEERRRVKLKGAAKINATLAKHDFLGRADKGFGEPSNRHRKFTAEELLEFVKKNGIRKAQDLEKISRNNLEAPTMGQVKNLFYNWQEVIWKAYGAPRWMRELSAEYFLKCVVEFDLFTAKRYMEARRSNPDVIPPWNEMIKCWGTFGTLAECARRQDISRSLKEYAEAFHRNGDKPPTSDQLQEWDCRIGAACRVFGGKEALDKFMAEFIRGRVI